VSETSLLFNFLKGRDTASPHMATVGNNALAMAARLKSSSSLAGLGMATLVSGIAGAAAEAVAFTDAIAPMAGLLAALPAVAFAGAASLGVLAIGLHGLGKAMASTPAGQKAYEKLPAASKALVDTLKALAPAWRQVQASVAQGLFAGVSKDIRDLAKIYIPVLRAQLPAVASGWNLAFRGTAALFKSPGFIKDMNTSLRNTAKFSQAAGGAMAPFLDGLRQIGTVGSAFLPRMGAWLRDIAVSFDAWAMRARRSGEINKWITDGIEVAGKFGTLLLNVGRSIRDIFSAGNAGPGFLDTLVKGSAAFAAWTASAKGQSVLHEFFTSLRDVAKELWGIVKGLTAALVQSGPGISTVAAYFSVAGAVVKVLADNMDTIRPLLPILITGFVAWKVAMVGAQVALVALRIAIGLATAAQWAWNVAMTANPIGLVITAIALIVGGLILLWKNSEAFRKFWIDLWVNHIGPAVDWVYRRIIKPIIDAIFTGIKGANDALDSLAGRHSIPGKLAPIPRLPRMAEGGIVTRPTVAMIGEDGPEAVVPLGRGGGGGNHYTINVYVAPGADLREVGRVNVQAIQAYERANGRRWRTP
jgi:Phage-related protein